MRWKPFLVLLLGSFAAQAATEGEFEKSISTPHGGDAKTDLPVTDAQ